MLIYVIYVIIVIIQAKYYSRDDKIKELIRDGNDNQLEEAKRAKKLDNYVKLGKSTQSGFSIDADERLDILQKINSRNTEGQDTNEPNSNEAILRIKKMTS